MKRLLLFSLLSGYSFLFAQPSPCTGTIFTAGPNAFGTAGNSITSFQNCLSYNKDLNAVLWIHQASPSWNFAGNTPGAIQATWRNIITGVWDSTILYYDPANQNPARYPGGTFFNPVGNTSVTNAYVVGSGPVSIGDSALTGVWYSSRQLTGTGSDQNPPATDMNYVQSPSNLFGSSVFMNYDMQQSGNRILVGGELRDLSTSTNANNNSIYGGVIGACDFSSGSPVWSYDSIVPGYYFNNNSSGKGYATDGMGGRLAFGPNGMTGYWIGQGRLATSYGTSADSTLSPIIYKTIDGGQHWYGPLMPGYDWSFKHPELMTNVGKCSQRPQGYLANHFKINPKHGFDCTVDSFGRLHLVASFTDPYADGNSPDSLSFSYTYDHDYVHYHPVIWDLMTDGTSWDALMVDSIMTGPLGNDPSTDTTSTWGPWTNASAKLGYGARIQVGRSTVGDKIFYSWTDSDTSLTYNVVPDIHMKSLDIAHLTVTPSINVTQGNGKCFFHYMSEVVYYDNAQSAWICPMVYTSDRNNVNAPYNATDVVNYHYLDCGVFTHSQYTYTATIYTGYHPGGIQNISPTDFNVYNYPNPFCKTTTIIIGLEEAQNIDLKVYDVLGNKIYAVQKNGIVGENKFVFDGAGLQPGVYYYSMTIDDKSVTRKMILQK